MKLSPWLVLLSLLLVSCSGSKSAQKVNEESPQIELSDADEFIDNTNQEPAEVAAAQAPAEEDPTAAHETMEEPVTHTEEAVTVAPEATGAVHESQHVAGASMQYTVQKNETLMLIAFKLYGDYDKWKHLAHQNQKVLKGGTLVRSGMVLSYQAPSQEFVWNPQGLPYLIRTGDTLGGISKSVYTTTKKWKLLWENNKPLIKDPNKIFAGFTLYYLENGREVASGI